MQLTYVGPPSTLTALTQALSERGVSVEYEPPFETKDAVTALAATSVVLAVTGPLVDVREVVRWFTSRFPGTDVRGLPDDSGATIEDRLAQVDRLQADGVISADEQSAQRSRILGEI